MSIPPIILGLLPKPAINGNLAGYDTTANTIIFSTITLALYDRVQNRLIEEVDRIYNEAEKEGRDELTFTDDLPKFRYLLAFMVRQILYPVVWHSLKLTDTSSTKSCASSPSSSQSAASPPPHKTSLSQAALNQPQPRIPSPQTAAL